MVRRATADYHNCVPESCYQQVTLQDSDSRLRDAWQDAHLHHLFRSLRLRQ